MGSKKSKKKLPPLSEILEERFLAEDSADPLVNQIDTLIHLLAIQRDRAAALPPEEYLRSKARLAHETSRRLRLTAIEHHKAGRLPSEFEEAAQAKADREADEFGTELMRKTDLRSLIERLWSAVMHPPKMTLAEKRELLLGRLRINARVVRSIAAVDEIDVAEVARKEAGKLPDSLRGWWPEIAERLRKNLEKVVAYYVAAKPGRPPKGQSAAANTAAAKLDALLVAIGLGSLDTHKRAKRRARRRSGSP